MKHTTPTLTEINTQFRGAEQCQVAPYNKLNKSKLISLILHPFCITLLISIGFFNIQLFAQEQDGYLIQFENAPSKEVLTKLARNGINLTKRVFDKPIIYLANYSNRSTYLSLEQIQKFPQVEYIQPNRRAELRNTEPNDPLYNDMWHLHQVQASQAWDFSTSGVTNSGDTVVLGVFDSGFELDHPDLAPNFWKNRGEIPNDGIDNDKNGYVDDYIGINFTTGADDHKRSAHGTEVSGVMGAVGNNDLGVSGVSWNAKLIPMSKSVGGLFEADFIEAYQYIINLRKKYNSSNGSLGAFVVAVNLSIGIPKAMASDYPMWCGVYDEIGRHGILGVCATDNDNYNVDLLGDMPTTCPSSYLIAVTGSNRQDNLMSSAAFGEVHIDLTAPGDDILSTGLDREYTINSGTSLATPQVTGAIALMYMAASDDLLRLIASNPSNAALIIRDLLLSSVEKNNGLTNKVASGGRLDLSAAILAARNFVDGPAPDALDITKIYPTIASNFVTLEIDIPSVGPTLITILDMHMGRTNIRYTEALSLPVGSNIYQVPVGGLAAGGYLISVSHGDEEVSRKFLVAE